jgi:hypothetical protein
MNPQVKTLFTNICPHGRTGKVLLALGQSSHDPGVGLIYFKYKDLGRLDFLIKFSILWNEK